MTRAARAGAALWASARRGSIRTGAFGRLRLGARSHHAVSKLPGQAAAADGLRPDRPQALVDGGDEALRKSGRASLIDFAPDLITSPVSSGDSRQNG